MSPMFAPAHFCCSHSTPSTLTPASSIPSSRTTSQVTLPIIKHCAAPPNEESGPLAKTTSPTCYEPNVIDNFDYSETTEIFLQEQSSGTMPSYLHDAELSDETIGKALSSPLFTQEREEPAGRRQAYHSFEQSLLPCQSLSVCDVSPGRPVNELSSRTSCSREKPSREMEKLQKSHVLEVEELSRRKLAEDFEKVTSFFQGSNVKTVYIFGDNDAKCQMLRLTTSTPGIRWLHHCTFRNEKQMRTCCRFITRKRESLCQRAQSIFSKYGKPVTGCHKSANLTKS